MLKVLHFIVNFVAFFLPRSFDPETRLLLAKTILIGLLLGYLLAFPVNFFIKKTFLKLREWVKEKKRNWRLASKKIPGAVFLGEITQFLNKLNVAVVEIKNKELKVGDPVFIKGKVTQLSFQVDSLQINKQQVAAVKKGQEAGMQVPGPVHAGDLIYKIKKK